jgi:hypothetical protein
VVVRDRGLESRVTNNITNDKPDSVETVLPMGKYHQESNVMNLPKQAKFALRLTAYACALGHALNT